MNDYSKNTIFLNKIVYYIVYSKKSSKLALVCKYYFNYLLIKEWEK